MAAQPCKMTRTGTGSQATNRRPPLEALSQECTAARGCSRESRSRQCPQPGSWPGPAPTDPPPLAPPSTLSSAPGPSTSSWRAATGRRHHQERRFVAGGLLPATLGAKHRRPITPHGPPPGRSGLAPSSRTGQARGGLVRKGGGRVGRRGAGRGGGGEVG